MPPEAPAARSPEAGSRAPVHAYFNLRLDGADLPDRVGQPVADREAAREAARTIIRGLVLRHGGSPKLLGAVMVVSDGAGATLLEMPVAAALYQPVEPVFDPRRRPGPARATSPSVATRLRAVLRPVRTIAGAVGARMQPPNP